MNHDLDPISIPVTFFVGDVSIDDEYTILPTTYSLDQNYPNPFNAKTEIKYTLPADTDVRLEIYNVLGQKVITLVDENQKAGYYSMIWDGRSETGESVTSGIYFYRLVSSEGVFKKSMVLLK
jgi:flagellar hook assembly protein FlgD